MTDQTLSKEDALKQLQDTQKVPVVNNVKPIGTDYSDIPEPKLIINGVIKPDFPIENLPEIMRNAVLESQEYTQAPVALIASCLLGIVSLAGQGLVKVRRDSYLVSPVSLYIVVLALSGERKSTVEYPFKAPLTQWIKQTRKKYASKWSDYHAKQISFEAKEVALAKEIKANIGNEKDLERKEKEYSELLENKPVKPLKPKLLFGDTTLQSMTDSLDNCYPTSGVVSSEGGAFLNSSLTKNSVTDVLAFLNHPWSGETYEIGRKGDGDTTLGDIALTLSIAIQPKVYEEFSNKGNGMAKETGFEGRVLLCHPESTQGTRFYKPPKENNIAIEIMNERVSLLLSMTEDHIEDRRLKRETICLSEDALKVWISYSDTAEAHLGKGNLYEDLGEVCSKSGDNSSRIACLFHLLESDLSDGIPKEISAKHMEDACKVSMYYLTESLINHNLTETHDDFKQAEILSDHLTRYCIKRKQKPSLIKTGLRWNELTRREVQRCAPNKIKRLKELKPVLSELIDADHIIDEFDNGKGSFVYVVNPKLVR